MVPPCSDRITRVPPYSFARLVPHTPFRIQDCHLLWPDFPDRSARLCAKSCWAFPFSLATTQGISVDFCSSGHLDVSVPRVRFHALLIQTWMACIHRPGFPIRTPPDQSLFANSPRIIAGYDVLHRLLPPGHPPFALTRSVSYTHLTLPTNREV